MVRNPNKKAIWIRWIICGLLFVTAALDFFTFAIEEKFQVFDMSLLTIWTSNIILIFILKFTVIGCLIYLLVGVDDANDYWKYLWIMMAVYLILFQTVGAISNRQVALSNPPIESAPTESERASVGINFALMYAYYPIGFSMLSFWIFNNGWKKKEEK